MAVPVVSAVSFGDTSITIAESVTVTATVTNTPVYVILKVGDKYFAMSNTTGDSYTLSILAGELPIQTTTTGVVIGANADGGHYDSTSNTLTVTALTDVLNTVITDIVTTLRNDANIGVAGCTVMGAYGEYEAGDVSYPLIVVDHVGDGTVVEFIGGRVTNQTTSLADDGEWYGISFTIDVMVDRESELTGVTHKDMSLLRYMMHLITKAIEEITWSWTVTEQSKSEWMSAGFDPDSQLYGNRVSFNIVVQKVR